MACTIDASVASVRDEAADAVAGIKPQTEVHAAMTNRRSVMTDMGPPGKRTADRPSGFTYSAQSVADFRPSRIVRDRRQATRRFFRSTNETPLARKKSYAIKFDFPRSG